MWTSERYSKNVILLKMVTASVWVELAARSCALENDFSIDAFHFDVVLKRKKSDFEENVLFCIWIDWTAWLQSALTLWSNERQIIFKRSNDQHKTKFEYILTGTYTQPSYKNSHTFKKLLWFFSNDKNYRESVEKWHYNRFGLCSSCS